MDLTPVYYINILMMVQFASCIVSKIYTSGESGEYSAPTSKYTNEMPRIYTWILKVLNTRNFHYGGEALRARVYFV